MFYIYVLRSLRNNKRYVGFTSLDPGERLIQHNAGCNKWSRCNRPFLLIHKERHKTSSEAREREKFLKSGIGRKELDRILERSGRLAQLVRAADS